MGSKAKRANKPVPKAPDTARKRKNKPDMSAQERERRMAFYTSQVMVIYIGLMNDAAIQAIERMHEDMSKEKIYSTNAKFKEDIDALLSSAQEMDNRLAGVATPDELQFYTDLRDGGTEYLTPMLNEVFEGYNILAKCGGNVRSILVGEICTCYMLIKHSVTCAQKIISKLEASTKCEVQHADYFIMLDALLILSRMKDAYVKPFPRVLQPSINALYDKMHSVTTPKELIAAAAKYAEPNADKDRFKNFKERIKKIFKIKL